MELSPGVRPVVPCSVDRPKRNQYYGRAATCSECGVAFLAARPQVLTDSPRCRKARSRRLAKEAIEAERMRKELQAAGMPVKKKKGKDSPAKLTRHNPSTNRPIPKGPSAGRGKRGGKKPRSKA